MTAYRHAIRRLSIEVDVTSEDLALEIRPRITDWSRRLKLELQRLFDQASPTDRHIRIDRIDIDLGFLPADGFEERATAVLTGQLRQAILAAMADTAENRARIMAPGQAAMEMLEQYLARGTLPLWAAPATFSTGDTLLALADSDPKALDAMIRRLHGGWGLERLVRQVDEAALRRVIALLEPEHAALIIAYLSDLDILHRREPVLPLSDRAFSILTRRLTLAYLTHDPGTHFNRITYVSSLLDDLAREHALAPAVLLAALARAVNWPRQALPLASSLPAVIRELASRAASLAMAPARDDAIEVALALQDPKTLMALLREPGRRPTVIEALVASLDEDALGRLLDQLEPLHAGLIIAYLTDLRGLHRAQPLVALGPEPFARLLWFLSLSYLTCELGSQFNRKSYVGVLIDGVARSEGLDRLALIRALSASLSRTGMSLPLHSSLPAVIQELAQELAPGPNDIRPALRLAAMAALAAGKDWGAPLTALMETDAAAARELLSTLTPAGTEAAALTATCPAALLPRLLALLRPKEAPLLAALARALAEVPPPDRPTDAGIHAALAEMLAPGRPPLTAAGLRRLIARVWFGQEPPAAALRFLSARVDFWRRDGLLGAAPLALIEAALVESGEAAPPDQPAAAPAPSSPSPEAVLALLRGDETPEWGRDHLMVALERMLRDGDPVVAEGVRRDIARLDLRALWLRLLPATLLALLVAVIDPRCGRALLETSSLLAEAEGQRQGAGGRWSVLLDYLGETPPLLRCVDGLAARVLRQAEDPAALRRAAADLAREAGRTGLAATLAATLAAPVPPAPPQAAHRVPGTKGRTAFAMGEETEDKAERTIYIDNAGLVLTSAFLPHLMRRLDWVSENNGSPAISSCHLSRAVHLTEFLVTGGTATTEPLLALNKVLCGVAPEVPVDPEVTLAASELGLGEELLRAVLGQWHDLSSTSIEGLRNTFLRRPGRLDLVGGRWRLIVNRRTEDILIDRVPWPVRTVSLPWMPDPLFVTW